MTRPAPPPRRETVPSPPATTTSRPSSAAVAARAPGRRPAASAWSANIEAASASAGRERRRASSRSGIVVQRRARSPACRRPPGSRAGGSAGDSPGPSVVGLEGSVAAVEHDPLRERLAAGRRRRSPARRTPPSCARPNEADPARSSGSVMPSSAGSAVGLADRLDTTPAGRAGGPGHSAGAPARQMPNRPMATKTAAPSVAAADGPPFTTA